MHIFFHGCCFGSRLCFWDLFTLFNKCATLLHLSSLLPSIVLCKYTNNFFCSSVDVHIDCFLLFAIINYVDVNIPVCVSSRTFSKVFLSIYQWNDLPSCKVFSISVSLENNKFLPINEFGWSSVFLRLCGNGNYHVFSTRSYWLK